MGEADIALSAEDYNRTCEILARLPCPTIGLEDPLSPPSKLSATLDVIVSTEKEARLLVKNIRRYPLAAMTLVQLLRHTDGASIADGLFAESLAFATLQGGAEFKTYLASRKTADTSSTDSDSDTKSTEPAVTATRIEDQLTLTLNRPKRLNAYSIAMRDALIEGLQLLASDNAISKAVIRGAGTCFCVGGDLTEFGLFTDTANAHAIRSTRNAGLLISENASRIECHVHRACIGSGIELPAFCRRIVATEDTFFQLPEITMGLIPGAGGTVSIARRIGRQRTAYLALSAKKINTKTALSWGLIDATE